MKKSCLIYLLTILALFIHIASNFTEAKGLSGQDQETILLQRLVSNDPKDRIQAGAMLGEIGVRNIQAATPFLAKALSDSEILVRIYASEVISLTAFKQGKNQDRISSLKTMVPLLLENSQNTNEKLRAASIRALALVDSSQSNVIISRLDDPSEEVREYAAVALKHITPFPITAFPTLLRRLNEETAPEIRAIIVQLLGESPIAHDFVMTGIINALNDKSDFVRQGAINGLLSLGDAATPAISKLQDMMVSPNRSNFERSLIQGAITRINDTAQSISIDEATKVQGIAFNHNHYDYAPSVIFDGKYRMWWCGLGVKRGSRLIDHIYYSESPTASGPWTTPKVVFKPTFGDSDFDGEQTCDPSVIVINGKY